MERGVVMVEAVMIKKKTIDGELTDAIKDVVVGEVIGDCGTVTVSLRAL